MGAPAILIAGTHGSDDGWWKPGSEFCAEAEDHGVVFLAPGDPFLWSTALDGIIGGNEKWAAAGAALRWYAGKHKEGLGEDRKVNLVAHSHGGQVAAYALAQGLAAQSLVTVATPVRRDMEPVWRKGFKNADRWVHIHSGWPDYWQLLGSLFDGSWRATRRMPLAGRNVKVGAAGHTGLLDYRLWTFYDWWRFVRA